MSTRWYIDWYCLGRDCQFWRRFIYFPGFNNKNLLRVRQRQCRGRCNDQHRSKSSRNSPTRKCYRTGNFFKQKYKHAGPIKTLRVSSQETFKFPAFKLSVTFLCLAGRMTLKTIFRKIAVKLPATIPLLVKILMFSGN